MERYFTREDNGYRVAKEIREMVIFAPQNVVMDPPFTKLDLLCCRNLLIYLTTELQKKLLPLFHYSLNPGGILFLGSAETIGQYTELFSTLEAKSRLYRRTEGGPAGVEFPTKHFFVERESEAAKADTMAFNLQALADQVLLRNYAPAAVLVNDRGDIIYINGRTGKYLEPAAGKANWNLYAMAREGLRHELMSGFQKVARQGGSVTLRGLHAENDTDAQGVDISITALEQPSTLRGMIFIAFQDVTTPPPRRTRRGVSAHDTLVADLEGESQMLREELQSTREEMQSSQEELKSANEELQSANEELQSTNEELTTSKEEMQSLNEELQTVNAELQAKVDDFSRASNDLNNLLNSTDIATVFLDQKLRVRRYTTPAARIIKLIPSDVGRPLSDLMTELVNANLEQDAREVLSTLVFQERQIPTHDGHWYVVRILPYRTMDNRIDGVVITFADISSAKRLEQELRQTISEGILEQGSEKP